MNTLKNEVKMKMSIEQHEYNNFLKQWEEPSWHRNLRFGQAFYNYFNLFKMKQTQELEMLYNLDGVEAEKMIREMFDIH